MGEPTQLACQGGGKNFCLNAIGNGRQPLATTGPQAMLRLAFGVHHAAKDAPQSIVGRCNSPAHALAVSIASGNHKLDYIAACVGKSRGYVSRLQSGKRPIPDRLIDPLCAATGTNLLRQFVRMQRAFEGMDETKRLAEMLRSAA